MTRRRKHNRQGSPWTALLSLVCVATLAVGFWVSGRGAGPSPRITSGSDAASPAAGTLRIASWNIRQLGSRASTDLRLIARLITQNEFDVVAIQEVQRDGRGVDRLLNELGAPWRGTRVGPESKSGERLTFIYRGDRVSEVGNAANLPGASPSVFERVPYSARFRAGSFDFEAVTVHLSWGDTAQRQREMQTLATLVGRRAASQEEKDLVILGDFNEQAARRNLPYMAAAGWNSLIEEATNLSSKEIYDHILLNQSDTREYVGRFGVVRFDEALFADNDEAAADAVSDHRPVWADFSMDLPDDD